MVDLAFVVYILCAATSAMCATLLIRAYRRSRARLLLWSSVCFACFALNSLLLVIDVGVLPDRDLSLIRTVPSIIGVAALLYGLVWDAT
jgi:hypothetical protein